ncbi:MAG: tRNA guanosine(34) transglycosylase Tgt [Alphaproteobacteria bacterium]
MDISYEGFSFDIIERAKTSKARRGVLMTPHGALETPNFIFCGTKAAMKGVTMQQMKEANTSIVLANTYHLLVQPGADVIERLGGLHRVTGWNGPMLTDSGGFQIFSMNHRSISSEIKGRGFQGREISLLKIAEEGATFRAYNDGRALFLSPEKAMEIQWQLGADLVVQLDECTPFHVSRDYTAKSLARTWRWGDRCLQRFSQFVPGKQAVYGLLGGGIYEDLRRASGDYTRDRAFFGTAIGDCMGSTKEELYQVTAWAMESAHPDRPVHLLGIGGIADIFEGVALGVDTFDCVAPTRMARHGWALLKGRGSERLNLRNSRFRMDTNPIDSTCGCYSCKNFSRGYIHHLIRAQEILAGQLLSIHNVFTMNRLLADIRQAITADTLAQVKKEWLEGDCG